MRYLPEWTNGNAISYQLLDHIVPLSRGVDWHVDWRNGYRWDETFYADLRLYHVAGHADIKYPWELSRHQFFVEFAAAAGDDAGDPLASRIRELWLDWIERNPLYQGVNWTSGLEAGMRAISWIWTFAALEHWKGWRPGDLDRISHSMVEHATYLKDHFSYFSSPYNHLIGEATALYLLSETLAEHPSAGKWRKQARRTLIKHAPRQFYADGFSVEQGTSYHFYTLGFLTVALLTARRSGEPLSDIEPLVQHAFRAAMPFRRPDGRWPAVGDLDSARALPVKPDDFWNFDGLCGCAAVMFDDPQLIAPGAEPGEELFWLFGDEGIEKWKALSVAAGRKPSGLTSGQAGDSVDKGQVIRCVMPDSGYVIASDGSDWMLFDAGPIAAGLFPDSTPSTAHGHADTLQVLYFADGQMLLDDSGIPFYNGDADWIRYFRGPKAHNTVEIEGVEFVHPEGRLAWSREVKRPELSADLSDDAWLCRGRVEWPGVTFERHLLGLPGNGLWIADWIETDRPRDVSWYWQLPAMATLHASGEAVWDHFTLTRAGHTSAYDSSLMASRDDRPEGLRCHGYGEKAPGAVLVQRQRVEDRTLVLTSVGRAGRPQMRVEFQGQTVGGPGTEASESWQHDQCVWKRLNSDSAREGSHQVTKAQSEARL